VPVGNNQKPTNVASVSQYDTSSLAAPSQPMLVAWQQLAIIRSLDLALVQFCQQQTHSVAATAPMLWPWLALASAQLAQGHLCLDLALAIDSPAALLPASSRYGRPLGELEKFVAKQSLESVRQLLVNYPQLIRDADAVDANTRNTVPEPQEHGIQSTPFVLAGTRLYLQRYWRYEQQIKAFIAHCQVQDAKRLQQAIALGRAGVEQQHVQTTLDILFADSEAKPDWQRIACALATTSSFAVITGGPGTGKTTTVVKLLLLLQQLAGEKPIHIELAAPTGKAAARLTQSIAGTIAKLSGRADLVGLPWQSVQLQAQTIHRLLGTVPGRQAYRHHQGRPLPLDVLVVDEASMVDVELMSALLQALPAHARLILLGDKDQLASVEAGAILGELCKEAQFGGYSEVTAARLTALSGQAMPAAFVQPNAGALEQHIVMLRTSHRFAATSAIGQLAAAVNAGNERQVQQLFAAMHSPDPSAAPLDVSESAQALAYLSPLQQPRWLTELVLGSLQHGLWPLFHQLQHPLHSADEQATALLALLGQFQILCAVRQGPFGVEHINQQIEQLLRQHRLIARQDAWYAGRPVMISQNDYSTGLMNGDIGICVSVSEGGRELLKVAFASAEGIRWFLPSRLPALETVFAMTVHKSQGSEFSHAALILPDLINPVLTRELLYTGITRAAQRFTLVASDLRVMYRAMLQPTERRGGLRL
jgi:exodeoxyribonuclease V alpha subunit